MLWSIWYCKLSFVDDGTVEDSSDDYIGIYIAPVKQIVSMDPPVTRIDSEGKESQQKINFARGNNSILYSK